MRRINEDFASPELKLLTKQLGEAVKAARIARNISRADFCERANLGLSTLARIEGGDVAVNFLAWLQAFERAGIVHLLAPMVQLHNDVVGETYRKEKSVKNPRKRKTNPYDF